MKDRDPLVFRIITLFPDFFSSSLQSGLLGKAIESGIICVDIIDLRKYSEDKFHRCDDYSYGGGSGMVLKPEPLFAAIKANRSSLSRVLLTSAGGTLLKQDLVKELSGERDLCIICGHYEGVDQRVIDTYVDDEISIGDYVLSGGEYAALVILNTVSRYVPGFMSNTESLTEESFEEGLLEYPHYTRPPELDGQKVPEVLLSGNHAKIQEWRLAKSIEKTREMREDLYRSYIQKKKGEML